jgi:hypothetical protein
LLRQVGIFLAGPGRDNAVLAAALCPAEALVGGAVLDTCGTPVPRGPSRPSRAERGDAAYTRGVAADYDEIVAESL